MVSLAGEVSLVQRADSAFTGARVKSEGRVSHARLLHYMLFYFIPITLFKLVKNIFHPSIIS